MNSPVGISYEILQVDFFEGKSVFGTIGMAFLMVEHGLSVHYVCYDLFEDDIDENNEPIISFERILAGIDYELDSQISASLSALKRGGYFREGAIISSFLGNPNERNVILVEPRVANEVIGMNKLYVGLARKDENSILRLTELHDTLATKLADIITEIERKNESFSKDWYLAKICLMYFSRKTIGVNTAFSIGILVEQMSWKLAHETDAQRGISQLKSLISATEVQAKQAPKTAVKKRAAILKILLEEYAADPNLMRNDSAAARRVEEVAKDNRIQELYIKSSNSILGSDAIKKHIRALRKAESI